MSTQHDVLDAIISVPADDPDPIGTIATCTGLPRARVSAVAYKLVTMGRATSVGRGRWEATDEGRRWLATYRNRAGARAREKAAREARAARTTPARRQAAPTGKPVRLGATKRPHRQLPTEGWIR